ncbi:class I SAM-dependent methyltransferase [Streptomyces pactum]|uniref:Class I SAM-dependent methyltransferase n=1 Tax=Streptomyces pactum TaxID=68249 RepID=A0ABS0NDP4_9ACTN|nr:class I SAM-dependent methyltransferase [Streptomyces pactum]MBH5333320.1 class I SAM-dependent methyltransferase [Streptomyces pactum]
MPTPWQGQPDKSPSEPHHHRQTAESFGVDAERYDRSRPPYPQALVDRIVTASPGRHVLDVGAGTGIAARQFRAAGCTVLGVEPDERMAAFARRSGVEVEVARFEDWQPAGRQFDAVIAGTAWHWVDPVAGAAKAAQVLRPGGRLAPFHHVPQPPAEVIDALTEALRRVAPDSSFDPRLLRGSAVDAYQPMFEKIADGIRRTGSFSEPEQWRFTWERTYSREEWLDQLPTFGGLTQLPGEKMAAVLDSAGNAIDMLGGRATMPYTTVAVTSTRLPAA